jgi:RND family efflux transporter MFP subunit
MTVRIRSASFLAVLLWFFVGTPLLSQAEEIQAISAPSADITLSFVVPGRLAKVLVKEGDFVKKDQLLASLDDEPERIQARQLKVQGEDRTRIMAAEAELAQKRVDLKKLELAKTKGAASDWEIEHVRLSVRIAELSLKAATLEHEQYGRRYAQAVSELERMRLVSPIEGWVEKVVVKPGEAARTLGPVIQLVKTDPLWIDVPVPLTQAKKLTLGQEVLVTFPETEAARSPNGRVIHISAVADAASDTLGVRIEIANPHGRPAGERIIVNFAKGKGGADFAEYRDRN